MADIEQPEKIRLNKFVGQSGLCTRREAANRIKGGLIKVNGEVVKDPATMIRTTDLVTFGKKVLLPKVDYTYILVNKPKNTVSTTEDMGDQKTLQRVFGGKVKDPVIPVEPLSKDDTGLLLLTTDQDLIKKLSEPNPKSEVVYHLTLDKPLSPVHLTELLGLEKTEVLRISGINEVRDKDDMSDIEVDVSACQYEATRKAFESRGYQVKRMDRIYYYGLTKKDLARDRFRHLTEKEVIMLKHFA